MKVIIAGMRDFEDYDRLVYACDLLLKDITVTEIVSGKAPGADTLGEDYAKERGYKIAEFPADWNKFKKAAGPIRNGQMAKYGDMLIAFWDRKSTGTGNMIKQAIKNDLKVSIIDITKPFV